MIITVTELREKIKSRLNIANERNALIYFFQMMSKMFDLNEYDELTYGITCADSRNTPLTEYVLIQNGEYLNLYRCDNEYQSMVAFTNLSSGTILLYTRVKIGFTDPAQW